MLPTNVIIILAVVILIIAALLSYLTLTSKIHFLFYFGILLFLPLAISAFQVLMKYMGWNFPLFGFAKDPIQMLIDQANNVTSGVNQLGQAATDAAASFGATTKSIKAPSITTMPGFGYVLMVQFVIIIFNSAMTSRWYWTGAFLFIVAKMMLAAFKNLSGGYWVKNLGKVPAKKSTKEQFDDGSEDLDDDSVENGIESFEEDDSFNAYEDIAEAVLAGK